MQYQQRYFVKVLHVPTCQQYAHIVRAHKARPSKFVGGSEYQLKQTLLRRVASKMKVAQSDLQFVDYHDVVE